MPVAIPSGVTSVGDHLKKIMNTIDTLDDPIELPAEEIDSRLADLSVRLNDFVELIRDYDFNSEYLGSPLYQIVLDVESLVYQVPYSERVIVRNTIYSVASAL